MITIKAPAGCNNYVSGDCLMTGRAYRLAISGTSGPFVDNIYIKGVRDIVSLSNDGCTRTPMACDKYVEVDLEITVKEKT